MRKAIHHLKTADPVLGALIERVGPYRQDFTTPTFENLSRSIVYQQLHGKAAATIFSRLLAAGDQTGRRGAAVAEGPPEGYRVASAGDAVTGTGKGTGAGAAARRPSGRGYVDRGHRRQRPWLTTVTARLSGASWAKLSLGSSPGMGSSPRKASSSSSRWAGRKANAACG